MSCDVGEVTERLENELCRLDLRFLIMLRQGKTVSVGVPFVNEELPIHFV